MADIFLTYAPRADESRVERAVQDILHGLTAYHVWSLLGWQDIRQRYRRSVLGPFWLTVSTGITVAMFGLLYGTLFRTDIKGYVPFLAVGMVLWGLISTILNEACLVFTSSEQIIKQVRAPLTLHVCRMVWRNLIVFAHNAVILVIVYVVTWNGLHWQLLLIPAALLVYALNGVSAGLIIGVLCTRFRDIAPIILNFVQIAFFATPIMWTPSLLKPHGLMWVAQLNPLEHYLEILRDPLLGMAQVPVFSWAVVAICTVIGLIAAIAVLARYRHRVPYWL